MASLLGSLAPVIRRHLAAGQPPCRLRRPARLAVVRALTAPWIPHRQPGRGFPAPRPALSGRRLQDELAGRRGADRTVGVALPAGRAGCGDGRIRLPAAGTAVLRCAAPVSAVAAAGVRPGECTSAACSTCSSAACAGPRHRWSTDGPCGVFGWRPPGGAGLRPVRPARFDPAPSVRRPPRRPASPVRLVRRRRAGAGGRHDGRRPVRTPPIRVAPIQVAPVPDDPFDVRIAVDATGLLREFNAAGVLNAADVHVADRLAQLGGESNDDRPAGGGVDRPWGAQRVGLRRPGSAAPAVDGAGAGAALAGPGRLVGGRAGQSAGR